MPESNVTRDHLANERTFLAYVRTALSLVAFGFVIARFSVFLRTVDLMQHHQPAQTHASVIFGIVMVFMGVVVSAFGLFRYKRQHDAIVVDGQAPLNVGVAAAVCALLAIVGVAVMYELYRIA